MEIRRPALATTIVVGTVASLVTAASASAAPTADRVLTPKAFLAHNLCAPPTDTVGPTAVKATFSRATVSLNGKNRTQTIRITAADTSGRGAASGVERIDVGVSGPRFFGGTQLRRVSGTATNGTWTGRITVSKYAHPGTYSINQIRVIDRAGNQQEYDGYDRIAQSPNSLSLHPAIDPTFAVTGKPATRPPRRPSGKLTTFTVSPGSLDTRRAAHYAHFSARFTGAAPSHVSVELNSVRKGPGRYLYLDTRLHDHNGTWTGSALIPRWLGKQSLAIRLSAQWSDRFTPQFRDYDTDRLAALHLTSSIPVTSGVDSTKPAITAIAFSPRSVDSTGAAQKVTVTARVHDTGSGVREVDVEGYIRNGSNGIAAGAYPFAAAGVGYLSSDDFTVRLTKTAGGRWVGTTTVRRCVPSGTYKLTASAVDHAGNIHSYSTHALKSAGITSTLKITSKHGDVVAPYVYSAATYAADKQLFLNFSEGVKHVDTTTLSLYGLSPASSRFTKRTTVSAIVCSNGIKAIACSGAEGAITSAKLTVPSLKAGSQYDVFANLDQVTTQLTDANNNPLDWNYPAAEVKGA